MFKDVDDLDFFDEFPPFPREITFVESDEGLSEAEATLGGRSMRLALFMSHDTCPSPMRPKLCASITGTLALDLPDSVSEADLAHMTKALRQRVVRMNADDGELEFEFKDELPVLRIWTAIEPTSNANEEKVACKLLRRLRETLLAANELIDCLESGELSPAHVATAAQTAHERHLDCDLQDIVLIAKYLRGETYNAPTDSEKEPHEPAKPKGAPSAPFDEDDDSIPIFL